jgi:hypothetical protein
MSRPRRICRPSHARAGIDIAGARTSLCQEHGLTLPKAVELLDELVGEPSNMDRFYRLIGKPYCWRPDEVRPWLRRWGWL